MPADFDCDIFITDIKKNMKRWSTNTDSIFYLTKSYWYQFRDYDGKIWAFRQSIKTYAIERGIMLAKNFPIGKKWLKQPSQAKKRYDNFFDFLAKT